MLDRRQFARRSVNLDVVVVFNQHALALGRTLNIGPSGVFVRTNPIAYSCNTEVELEFTWRIGAGKVQKNRVPVTVVHSSPKGMGLRFISSDETDYLMSHTLLGVMCNSMRPDYIHTTANG